jgi:uncharacterized membrane protein YccC
MGRTVAACVLTMLLVMAFKLPNGFLAAFYALALSRDDPRSTVRNGFAMIVANLAGIAVSLAGIVLFIDYPLFHFLFIVAVFFAAFFLMRTLANYNVAFGFGIIVVATASVNIIWSRGNPPQPDLGIAFWTGFGMTLGVLVTVLIEWVAGSARAPADSQPAASPLFVRDAFENPEYLKFALKGAFATTICYLVWSTFAWPGIGVCTVTCFIAAPRPIPGSSLQRLATRLAGLLFGGVVCGIGSQIWVLPAADSILGFTLPFAAASAAAAWAATASPRFSYFGRQMALAFYLTIFQGFGISASLTASRDRLMGILLGLLVMSLIFDTARKKAMAPAK